ncbi:MAG: pyruvate dehydrogenase (acetyl-transferring), homodimeric type [Actinomycetota bacterium]
MPAPSPPGFAGFAADPDPEESAEWQEALRDAIAARGPQGSTALVGPLLEEARRRGVPLPASCTTPYRNTIAPADEAPFPGDEAMETRIRRIVRWNAAAMVVRSNRMFEGLGGHLSTYASAAGLYEVGFNHFFRGRDHPGGGDQVFFQGHATPGIYARAFLEGRLSEDQLDHFRREAFRRDGLSSYPHPRLMPQFWEFPTVSMGLGAINAVHQARFNRYLHNRSLRDTSQQRVWAFLGDGEMDEPESLAALGIAAREQLDNLTFVVNCNLQRLDGPVRGNGKVIQELEAVFRGAGWNVVKVIWGRGWDPILEADDGALAARLEATVDGAFQRYAVEPASYLREHLFGGDPALEGLVAGMTDDDLAQLRLGGHDYPRVYAAYRTAVETTGAPTVLLVKTVKGWALGSAVEARNSTHQIKKMTQQDLRDLAERLGLEIPARRMVEEDHPPLFHPGAQSDEVQYLRSMRDALGGFVPARRVRPESLALPGPTPYGTFDAGTVANGQQVSTTVAFVRLLRELLRDERFGPSVVPIVPDEARTFGMESLFKEYRIYAPMGQRYEPVDAQMLLSYAEAADGQILEEGITEAGAMASCTAAGTAYATHGRHMVPFYLFYSMFGFQRIGDHIWSFGDARGRGFLLGCTAGRTTLNGEGLQHEDGHSQLLASTFPACRAYDPAFAYETAAIVRDGLRRMVADGEDVFYYLTLYNENHVMPAKPPGVDEGILRGIYRFRAASEVVDGERRHRAQLFGSGSILATQVLRAQELLAAHHDVAADVWSVTSYKLLAEDALEAERWNRLHPEEPRRVPYVTATVNGSEGPVIAATDWIKAVPSQIRPWIRQAFVPLGTDGYGRSDTREALRRHFEVDAEHIVVATLSALADWGEVKPEAVTEAIVRYGIDPERCDPRIGDAA